MKTAPINCLNNLKIKFMYYLKRITELFIPCTSVITVAQKPGEVYRETYNANGKLTYCLWNPRYWMQVVLNIKVLK